MPEMDGIETLSRILELVPSAKVIMLSGQDDAAGVVQAIKIGAADYLTKPVDEAAPVGGAATLYDRTCPARETPTCSSRNWPRRASSWRRRRR